MKHPTGEQETGKCEAQIAGRICSYRQDTDLDTEMMDRSANDDMIGIAKIGTPTTVQKWRCMATAQDGKIHIKMHGKIGPIQINGHHQLGDLKAVGETMVAAGEITPLQKKWI